MVVGEALAKDFGLRYWLEKSGWNFPLLLVIAYARACLYPALGP